MPDSVFIAVFVFGSYLLGCLNFGYYVVRFYGRGDVREHGSGNAGATNAARVLGKKGFVLVSVLDGAKGLLCVLVGYYGGIESLYIGIMAFFCILGHIYPMQLGFRGGRGVSTAFGCVLAISPYLLIFGIAFFSVSAAVSRRYHLSGIMAIASLPAGCLLLNINRAFLPGIISITLLILVQYRQRIKQLFSDKSV